MQAAHPLGPLAAQVALHAILLGVLGDLAHASEIRLAVRQKPIGLHAAQRIDDARVLRRCDPVRALQVPTTDRSQPLPAQAALNLGCSTRGRAGHRARNERGTRAGSSGGDEPVVRTSSAACLCSPACRGAAGSGALSRQLSPARVRLRRLGPAERGDSVAPPAAGGRASALRSRQSSVTATRAWSRGSNAPTTTLAEGDQ